MPINYRFYPKNWKTKIIPMIRKRSKNRCECTGECGLHFGRCNAKNHKPHPITKSKVILTVAHLGFLTGDKQNKMDVRPENLKHMCQRCHLSFDMADHIKNRKENVRKKLIKFGQKELF